MAMSFGSLRKVLAVVACLSPVFVRKYISVKKVLADKNQSIKPFMPGKKVVSYENQSVNPLMPGGNKRSNILKQICSSLQH